MCLFSTQCYCTYLPICPGIYILIPKYSFFIIMGCRLWKPVLQTMLYFLCVDKKQKFLELPVPPLCEAEQTDRVVIFPSLSCSSWEFITSFSPFFFFQLLNSLYMYLSVPYLSIYWAIQYINLDTAVSMQYHFLISTLNMRTVIFQNVFVSNTEIFICFPSQAK